MPTSRRCEGSVLSLGTAFPHERESAVLFYEGKESYFVKLYKYHAKIFTLQSGKIISKLFKSFNNCDNILV